MATIQRYRGTFIFRSLIVWPGPKTADYAQQGGQFGKLSYDSVFSGLRYELGALNAEQVILQVFLPESKIRVADGQPYAGATVSEPGVIVSFQSKWGPLSYPCDLFNTWLKNLRAITLAMESLRRVDRYGVADRGQQYSGYKAIAATSQGMTPDQAALTLVAVPGCPYTPTQIMASADFARLAVRHGIAKTHPDRNNGDRSEYDLVDKARAALTTHHGVSV